MTVKRLYIHIGHLKCGSSSIQNFLWDNKEALQQADFKYIESGIAEERFIGMRHYYLGGFTASEQCQWKEVVNEINSSEYSNFIISYEGLIRLTTEQIKYIHKLLVDFEVTIICYLRRQDYFIQSLYAEYVQNHGIGDHFDTFCDQNKWLCDYRSLLERWLRVFANKNVIVKNFDQLVLDRESLEKDFAQTINLSCSDSLFKNTKISNTTMCFEHLEIMHNLNFIEKSSRKRRRFAKDLLSKTPKKSRKGLFFSSRNILVFMQEFISGNLWLHNEFKSFNKNFSDKYEYPIRQDVFPRHKHLMPGRRQLMLSDIKESLKNVPYLVSGYRFLFRGLTYLKNRIPRSYVRWIKKSESFTQSAILLEKPEIVVVINAANVSSNELSTIIDSTIQQDYQAAEVLVILNKDQNLSERHINNKIISLVGYSDLISKVAARWVLCINHLMVLNRHSLREFAVVISQNSELIFAYSDHDYLDENNIRHDVHFKPDWNPDLFYEQEYIQGCCLFNGEHIPKDFDLKLVKSRNELYEMTLRFSNQLKKEKVGHISKVLFHFKERLPPIDCDFAAKTLKNYLSDRIATQKTTDGIKINWPIDVSEPLVSLIIPTRNGLQILSQAISSILDKTTYSNFEILIVDNQSDDLETIKYLKKMEENKKNVRVINFDFPFNYSAINNFAVSKSSGSIVGFINNDIEVISPDWLTEMVSQALRPEIGCVGAKLYYPDDTIQHAGVIVGLWGCAGHSHKGFARDSAGYCGRLMSVQNYSAVTAACLVMKKSIFESVDGFDETNLTIAFNDIDLCLKVKSAGFNNLWTPYAELYHHESISRGKDKTTEQLDRANKEIEFMRRTWRTHTEMDPAYNVNLSKVHEDFSLTRY